MNPRDELERVIGAAYRGVERRMVERRALDQQGDCVPISHGGTWSDNVNKEVQHVTRS